MDIVRRKTKSIAISSLVIWRRENASVKKERQLSSAVIRIPFINFIRIKTMKKYFFGLTVIILSACSGSSPSESDINEAFKKALTDEIKQEAKFEYRGKEKTQQQIDAELKERLPQFKKVGCKEDGEKAYRCDLEATAKDGVHRTVNMRFVKGSDGWLAAQ